MANAETIADSITTALATISGLHAYDVLPGAIVTPAAWIEPDGQQALSLDLSTHNHRYRLVLVTQLGTLEQGQRALQKYISTSGASSVLAALMTGLGGQLLNCQLERVSGVQVGGIDYAGAIFNVEVLAE